MAFGACIPTQAKLDLLNGVHNFSSHVFKVALYTQAAATDKNDTATTYNTTGELATSGNYTQGGITLSTVSVTTVGTTAYVDWGTDPSWASATFTADAAVIYNSSATNKIVAIYGFTSTSATNGTWTLTLPAPGATASIRVA